MSIHNMGFYQEMTKIIFNFYHQIPSVMHLFFSSDTNLEAEPLQIPPRFLSAP